ncbi:hypothetical protein [Tahibacter amnicola]|uniref:Polyketide cyclase/dehydrase/lipid transport protein n=1 Tax=Tahibacter amnicola TaxID=2976241 RepID=A0ABY6BND4_9GAMM|nr:hypothetical protein [Tahibacter amnicola]UXI69895.1 hypothetical protein N4264_09790 [Tahibacter amnicola]
MTPSQPVSREASFTLDMSLHRAMHCFTAEGERAWAPGWDPQFLSGSGEVGSVFRTVNEHAATIWIVVDFDAAAGVARYARVADGSHAGTIEVRGKALTAACTEITVRYTLTPTSPAGEQLVDELLSPQGYAAFIGGWKALIDRAPPCEDGLDDGR